jgi:hypothetical protein
VEVHCDEGVAIHIDPEPCVHVRESMCEAVGRGAHTDEPNPAVRFTAVGPNKRTPPARNTCPVAFLYPGPSWKSPVRIGRSGAASGSKIVKNSEPARRPGGPQLGPLGEHRKIWHNWHPELATLAPHLQHQP